MKHVFQNPIQNTNLYDKNTFSYMKKYIAEGNPQCLEFIDDIPTIQKMIMKFQK